jgi:hypothetical protein
MNPKGDAGVLVNADAHGVKMFRAEGNIRRVSLVRSFAENPINAPCKKHSCWGPFDGKARSVTVEVVTVYLVLRNVSEKTIRVSLPQHPDILSFRRDGTTISYSVDMDNGPMSFWELKPGHQTLISSPPIQVLAPNDLGLNRALTRLKPGPHTIYARVGSGGHRWVPTGEGTSRQFSPAKGEWTGWLSSARRPVEVLAEKVPFEIAPLEDLPDGHGLKCVFGSPPSLSKGHTEWIRLRYGLEFALDSSQDAHWLRDYGTYNRLVFWGPIPAARLKDLKLTDRIRQLSHEYIQTARHQN